MKLSKIKIDGIHNVKSAEYDLTDLTYFTGKNGAGKSTILQAIQFALLGYIPATGKTNSAMFEHCNCDRMSVTLEFDDGSSVSRTLEKVKSKLVMTTTPENFDAESLFGKLMLPILNFSDFIGMTANKLKDWYIDFLPDESGNLSLSAQMDAVVRESGINQILDTDFVLEHTYTASKQETNLETVRKFNESFKEELTGYKAELARIQHTIQSLVFYDDCDMSESEDEIKAKIDGLLDEADRMKSLIEHITANQMTELEIESCKTRILSDDEVSEIENRFSCVKKLSELLRKQIIDTDNEITVKQHEADQLASQIEKGGVCPYSNSPCQEIVNSIPAIQKKLEDIEQEIALLHAKKKDALTRMNTDTDDYNRLYDKLQNHKKANEKLEYLNGVLYSDCAAYDLQELQKRHFDIREQINELSSTMSKVRANLKYKQLVDTLEADKYKVEQKIEILKLWIKLTDVNGLQSKIMVEPFKKFAGLMSEILTSFYGHPVSAEFWISEKANDFSFGVMRDTYIEYEKLSSGEKCIFVFAMLIAMQKYSSSDLKIIMVDDFLDHLDDVMIDRLFKTLSTENEVQFIIAGVKACDAAAPYIVEVQR